MRKVDVEQGVVIGVNGIAAQLRPWRAPKVGPVRLVHARAGADDVDVAEVGVGDVKHVVQGSPRGHVRLDEHGVGRRSGRSRRMAGDDLLSLGTEG